MAEPQKSEVHAVTEDASTSPTTGEAPPTRAGAKGRAPGGEPRVPDLHLNDVEVVRDDSDVGGPIVVKSEDPDLKHVDVPKDPFPTDRKPEIDPPVR